MIQPDRNRRLAVTASFHVLAVMLMLPDVFLSENATQSCRLRQTENKEHGGWSMQVLVCTMMSWFVSW